MPGDSSFEEQEEFHRVEAAPAIPGLRQLVKEDIPQVAVLLREYLRKFQAHCEFTEESVGHMTQCVEGMKYTYVVEDEDKKVTDFITFYVVPYSVLSHPTIREYKVSRGLKDRERFCITMQPRRRRSSN